MAKSVAVTFCKEIMFNRKPGELSGVGLGSEDLDRLGVWAAQYADVQVTRHQLVDLLSDQERARALKQLGREGVEVGYPEVALVKNALPALLPHQPHVLDGIADEVFAMKFDSEEGSEGFFKDRIGDKTAFGDLKKSSGPSIPWRKASLLDEVRQKFREAWGYKFSVPVADCNLYQGPEGGMAFHGDVERNVVICLNVGEEGDTRELDFQAFEEGFPVSERLSITLEHGDIYILSEKAVGMDWRCETKITWRHAAGHKDTYRPDNEVLCQELDQKSAKVSRETKKYLKSIAAKIEKTHQMALVGVLERMDYEEVNEKDATGCTKLHWACNTDNPLAVAALLKMPNIEVNARNNSGYTPLMVAAAGCCVQSLKLLLEDPRVELNVANNDGVTLDKLIGSECYPCSCSKEFKKKQTPLLQMIIDKEKEARVGSSNGGPKDVIEGVLGERKKRKVGSGNRGQKDVIKGVLGEEKKRKRNAVSDDYDEEKDSKKKHKAEGDLSPTLSDDSGDEEKSNSKTEDDDMVKIEDNENTSSKEKDKSPHTSSENHRAVNSSEITGNCKNLKAKIEYKNFSDITSVEPVPFKEDTFATDFKTEDIETDIKTEVEKGDNSVKTERFLLVTFSDDSNDEEKSNSKTGFKTEYIKKDIKTEVVKKGLKEECINKDVKTECNEENLKMERFGKSVNMNYVKLEEFNEDENRLGKKKEVESNDSDFLKRKKSNKSTSKHVANNQSESDLSYDAKNINPSKKIKSGTPKAQVSYIALEGEEDEKIHTSKKPYNCEQCTKTFPTVSSLNRHKKIHTGEKPYQCKKCPKSFTHLCNFKVHERTHTGEKPFQCKKCLKSFTQLSNLKYHEKTHTGEKPFQCKKCSKSFTQLSNLKDHEKTHTGEKPFQCKKYPKTFSTASNLSQHNKSHTGQ